MVVDALEYLPGYARSGDAGADLRITESLTLQPGERRLVGTGVRIALPAGTFGMVTPRSGQAAKRGLGIVNSPGIIDSGYRGEIRICLINLDTKTVVELQEGERVAQLVVVPFISAQFIPVAEIDETERGRGGYGSTGQQ